MSWIAVRNEHGSVTFATGDSGDLTERSAARGQAKRFDSSAEAAAVYANRNPGEQALWSVEQVNN